MKSLAIVNTELLSEEYIENKEVVNILGTTVTCGVVDIARPNFDVTNHQNDDAKSNGFNIVAFLFYQGFVPDSRL